MLGLLHSPNVPSAQTSHVQGTNTTKLISMKPKARPFIMVLSFTNVGFFTEVYGDLLAKLQNKIEVLHGLSNERVIDLISSPDLSGIFVTDTAIVNHQNAYLLGKLVEYTKAGGTIVLGGTLSASITCDELKKFFSDSWSMPWEMGDYTRTHIMINGKHELAKKSTSLPSSFCVKAVHLQGVTPAMALRLQWRYARNGVIRRVQKFSYIYSAQKGYAGIHGAYESWRGLSWVPR